MFDIDQNLLKATKAKAGAFELVANIIPKQSCGTSTQTVALFSSMGDFYRLSAKMIDPCVYKVQIYHI
jgi:hypothetical protein